MDTGGKVILHKNRTK